MTAPAGCATSPATNHVRPGNVTLGIFPDGDGRIAVAPLEVKHGGTWEECAGWLAERGVDPYGDTIDASEAAS